MHLSDNALKKTARAHIANSCVCEIYISEKNIASRARRIARFHEEVSAEVELDRGIYRSFPAAVEATFLSEKSIVCVPDRALQSERSLGP